MAYPDDRFYMIYNINPKPAQNIYQFQGHPEENSKIKNHHEYLAQSTPAQTPPQH